MGTIQEMSSDNLVTLATGNFVRADVLEAVNAEILRRLKPPAGKMETLFDIEAIKKEAQGVKDILGTVDRKIPKWSDDDMLLLIKQLVPNLSELYAIQELIKLSKTRK